MQDGGAVADDCPDGGMAGSVPRVAGSVPRVVNLVVMDALQATVMAVMLVGRAATFDTGRQRGRRY
jgi:uncharacterized protein with ACT and thioredoxin-like domain